MPYSLVYYAPVLLVLWATYLLFRSRRERKHRKLWDEAKHSGLTEPASLHPVIDPNRCVGCGSCAHACPENHVIGVVGGKAKLIHPTRCIGHGACKIACPMDAITLVFGTEKRGIDIPNIQPDFQTNVPGLFIAGELGGMGLIRNAVEQGRQAMETIRKLPGIGKGDDLDVLIVGAGPAGFSASLGAKQHGLRAVTVEQESLGGTVFHYPRGKVVMTAPAILPIYGKTKFKETTKEELLTFWNDVEKKTGISINYEERMEKISQTDTGFEIKTSRGNYSSRAILLALGRRGTPRKLGVPGEELPKVLYRLIDPAQYENQHVLVVGGGDAALEAATSIAEETGTTVTLSYRSEAFGRAKEKNRDKVVAAESAGRLQLLMKSNVKKIGEDYVELEHADEAVKLPNDAIIVCAGGILPTPFLKEIGIEVDTKFGTV